MKHDIVSMPFGMNQAFQVEDTLRQVVDAPNIPAGEKILTISKVATDLKALINSCYVDYIPPKTEAATLANNVLEFAYDLQSNLQR